MSGLKCQTESWIRSPCEYRGAIIYKISQSRDRNRKQKLGGTAKSVVGICVEDHVELYQDFRVVLVERR